MTSSPSTPLPPNPPLREIDPSIPLMQREKERHFGLQVYSGLLQVALAFFRRYVGGEPKCKHCGQPFSRHKDG